jgi:thiosulfate/3-mercaptopyruvate sulfurtransferase
MTITANPDAQVDVVITAEQLRDQLASDRQVVVLEVHREPTRDAAQFTDHIPGAQLVILTTDLVGPIAEGSGSVPLPTEEQVQAAVARWGINDETLVVVYSRTVAALAARVWWTLRWAGVPDVRYLDGGLAAWVAAGGAVSNETTPSGAGHFTVALGSLPVLDTPAAASLARSGVLLDARNAESYAGDPEGSEGGHIPGALNLPSSNNLDADGLLKSDDELRAAFAHAGPSEQTEFGAYCGGGTSATLDVLALAKIGVTAALYPGSFSAWSADPSNPVATGNEPG